VGAGDAFEFRPRFAMLCTGGELKLGTGLAIAAGAAAPERDDSLGSMRIMLSKMSSFTTPFSRRCSNS
jgi:hypothetical protein